jgi:endo-1,4-beta-xylanase
MILALGCGAAEPSLQVVRDAQLVPTTLHEAAEKRSRPILMGTAVNPDALDRDTLYRTTLVREYRGFVPENAMKFEHTEPKRGVFTFDDADQIVSLAVETGARVRGHNLVWHQALPDWVRDPSLTPDDLSDILRNHIFAVVGHFRDRFAGTVFAWDVVNEAFATDATLRTDSPWVRIGPDPDSYIAKAFEWAHQADPAAELFYNDYSDEGLGTKANTVYEFVKRLKMQGVAIGGIGLQSHLGPRWRPPEAEVAANMQRLAALGLKIHVTELDDRLTLPVTTAELDRQAGDYRVMLGACLATPACEALFTWGISDKYSPIQGPMFGAPLPFDRQLMKKPSYFALLGELSR